MGRVNVLFVCSGNIFRSTSAEYCLKKYLRDNGINRFNVSSAGIYAKPDKIAEGTLNALNKLGINPASHRPRRLTKKIVDENDIIISMSDQHYDFIKENFGLKSFYFNELVIGKKKGIKDNWEVVPNWSRDSSGCRAYSRKVVKYIWKHIPKLAEELLARNFLFEDFINKKVSHRNGFPFIPVYESRHSVAFLSIDVPRKHYWHVLAVPRRRYKNLEEIPKPVLNDLISTVSFIGRVFKQSHGGYNVLLNNGVEAGQFIFHTHFHIIPRSAGDDIKLKGWKSQSMSSEDFKKHSLDLKRLMKRLQE